MRRINNEQPHIQHQEKHSPKMDQKVPKINNYSHGLLCNNP